MSDKANSSHTHKKSEITDFPTSLPASDVYSWAKASSKPSYSWSEITNKPSTFTPTSHTHDYLPTSSSCNKNWNWSDWKSFLDGTWLYRYNDYNVEINIHYWQTDKDYTGHNSIKLGQLGVTLSGRDIREMVFFRNTGSGNLHYYACIEFCTDGTVYLVTMGTDIPAGVMLEGHFMLGR